MKPKAEGPAAYVLPASDPRLGTQAELLRVLQKQGVEISRATAAFTVHRARAARAERGRPRRTGAAGEAAAAAVRRAAAGGGRRLPAAARRASRRR